MGREQDNEKRFNAYIDRILAGEEIKADPDMDKELRAALEFARKISALGAMPSAQFQARLKASLLQKLEAQQAQKKAARGGFRDIFKSHPAWQGAVAVILVIIALTIVWRAGVFQPLLDGKSTATIPAAATQTPVPSIAVPASAPAPATYTIAAPAVNQTAPTYILAIIIIGVILAILIIILIRRTRPLVWQGAVAVILVIMALAIVWRAGVFQPSMNEKVTTTVPATTSPPVVKTAAPATTAAAPAKTGDRGIGGTLVSIDATSDKASYQPGEAVKINLAMKNITTGQLIVKDFPPILSIMQEDTKQPVYTFSAGIETRTLAPYEAASFTYTWQEVDFKGNPVTGSYYIELEDLEYNGLPFKLNLNSPVRFEILSKTVY
jgi:hypothetical protein